MKRLPTINVLLLLATTVLKLFSFASSQCTDTLGSDGHVWTDDKGYTGSGHGYVNTPGRCNNVGDDSGVHPGNGDITENNGGTAAQEKCQAGQFNSAGSPSCENCQAGQSSNPGSSCEHCQEGQFSTSGSLCENCQAGQFSNSGSPSCETCLAGQSSNSGSSCVWFIAHREINQNCTMYRMVHTSLVHTRFTCCCR